MINILRIQMFMTEMKGEKMKQATNHDMMRSANVLTVFNCIRKFGPITKKHIQNHTGLSWGSISNIATTLLDKGVLVQDKSKDTALGRIPNGLDINLENNLMLGIDVNLAGLTGVIIDLKGRVKHLVKEPLRAQTATELIEQTKTMIRQLIGLEANANEINGIGIALPGHVYPDRGFSVWLYRFPGFEKLNFSAAIQEEFGLDVILEHDPNCMAVTEHSMGVAQDAEDLVCLRLSKGLGMGIILDGEIYRGKTGATGEIGHMIMNPDGPKCHCGNFGCLKTYASVEAIINQCSQGSKMDLTPKFTALLGEEGEITLDLIAQAAAEGDRYINSILLQAANYTGVAIANVVNIMDPTVVVLGGELAKYDAVFLDKVREVANKRAWKSEEIDIRVSSFGSESAAIGVASLFIQKVFLNAIDF